MRIDMVTLFPEMFLGPFGDSITKRAIESGILDQLGCVELVIVCGIAVAHRKAVLFFIDHHIITDGSDGFAHLFE